MLITLTLLIDAIFNNNIQSLVSNLSILPVTLLVVVCFFLTTYFLGLFISDKVGFTNAEKASLIMTSSARNTPLMLAISVGLFPTETVIQLILILGMLIEFPHLILLSFLLRKTRSFADVWFINKLKTMIDDYYKDKKDVYDDIMEHQRNPIVTH